MKRQSRSFEIALSAIACAIAVCALTLGAYVDFLLAAGFLIAVFALMVPLAKDFVWGYVLALLATVILSFLFNIDTITKNTPGTNAITSILLIIKLTYSKKVYPIFNKLI